MLQDVTPEWLERANRLAVTSTLLAATVHEVNNALQVISGSAEMLSVASAPDLIARRTEVVGAQARRASALLAELSSFAKDESDNPLHFDVGQLAQRALAMRQYTIAKLKLDSAFEARGESRLVLANPRAVLQIVLNLLVNAERAMALQPGGHIVVSVDGGAKDVTLTVEDNGPGISPEAAPRLFVPGALASETHLGIGLAVSRRLAGQSAGTLIYEKRAKGGCRFILTLPAVSARSAGRQCV